MLIVAFSLGGCSLQGSIGGPGLLTILAPPPGEKIIATPAGIVEEPDIPAAAGDRRCRAWPGASASGAHYGEELIAMTMTAKELTFAKGKTRSTLRAQRPRLVADAKKYKAQSTPPTNTSVPVIMGTGVVGHTLECTMGLWNGSPVAYGAQWMRDAAPIPKATFAKYLLVAADSGHSITCQVTAFTGGGQASVTSNAVAVT